MATGEVKTAGRPILLNLICKGLVGGKTITLEDESGQFQIKAPSQLWEFITPGDMVCVTISPIKATILFAASDPFPGLPKPN
jgi:hypothetical protein